MFFVLVLGKAFYMWPTSASRALSCFSDTHSHSVSVFCVQIVDDKSAAVLPFSLVIKAFKIRL